MSSSEWDFMPWDGTDTPVPFRLLGVETWDENTVLLGFSMAPYVDGLGTLKDGLNPALYSIQTVKSTGLDGRAVRPVSVTNVEPVPGYPWCLLVQVDRPFSPYPTQYTLLVNGVLPSVIGAGGALVATCNFTGLLRTVEPVGVDVELGRDFANPQHGTAMLDPLPEAGNAALLGVFPVDDAGDYAMDSGETSFQKRLLRRLFFTKGRTACLSKNYGLGILHRVKQLNTAHGRESLSTDAREQMALEPEVLEAGVQCLQDGVHPSLVWLKARARLRSTGKWSGFNMPFKTR